MRPCRGRPPRYVTQQQWQDFLNNHFRHLKDKVNLSMWLSGGILLILIGKLVIDFFWG